MAKDILPDDETIYSAFKDIFKGPNAAFRRPSPVQKLVHQHMKRPEIAQLISTYGESAVIERVRSLLANCVFESTLRARKRFPSLFNVSKAESAQREAWEAQAAACHAQTLEDAVERARDNESSGESGCDSGIENEDSFWGLEGSVSDSPVTEPEPGVPVSEPEKPQSEPDLDELVPEPEPDPLSNQNSTPALHIPSLFPMYLPFAAGHRILVKTQATLEAACFRFASQAIPEVLTRHGWDCPEATELNVILRQLLKHDSSLKRLKASTSSSPDPSQSLNSLCSSVIHLRHATVHRSRMTAKVLERLLTDAEDLAGRLDDGAATAALSRSRREVQRTVVEMENNKSMLETRLRGTLEEIAARRAELDRMEREAVASMVQADAEYQSFMGDWLEDILSQDVSLSGSGACESEYCEDSKDDPGIAGNSCDGNHEISVNFDAAAAVNVDADDLQNGYEMEEDKECFEDALEPDSI